MSMKIGENYPGCSTEYLEKVQQKAEPAKEMENRVNDNSLSVPKDEYISSEKSGNKPSGLYRMGQVEDREATPEEENMFAMASLM